MGFEFRDATVDDFGSCIPLMSKLLYEPGRRDALRMMWREILVVKSGFGFLAIDPAQNSRVVHFGFAVFVSDSRAHEYRRCVTPMIARRLVAEWADGTRPFLSACEIARANAADGLNALVTHYGSVHGDGAFDDRVRAANYESSRRAFLGWNLRSFTIEVFDRERSPDTWGASLGFRVAHYSPEALRAAGIAPKEAPSVWTSTREEAVANPGYAVGVLFSSFVPPRCGFTPSEQDILRYALDGKTDEAISRAGGVSLATAKKRFRTIYEKVRDGIPRAASLFSDSLVEGARGAEARRLLLNYMREHPEELRPYDAGQAATAELDRGHAS
jgi:hypothetical protein